LAEALTLRNKEVLVVARCEELSLDLEVSELQITVKKIKSFRREDFRLKTHHMTRWIGISIPVRIDVYSKKVKIVSEAL